MLNYEFPPLGGGSSSVSYEIGKRYVANGHDVDVVTMGFKNLPAEEEVDGMAVFRVPCLQRHVEITRLHELATYVHSAKRFLAKQMPQRDGKGDHPLAYRHVRDHLFNQMGRGLRHAAGATGRVKPTAFTGEGHQFFMGAVPTPEAQSSRGRCR